MILWNAELTKRLACSEREKALLPSLIGGLLGLCDSAKTEGFKSLAQSEDSTRRPFMAYGLRLIAEGLSSETIEEILAIYLATSPLSGYEFLSQCVCAEALLSLAAGDPRDLMLRKLAPYAGAQAATDLLETLGTGSEF
ncbi:MAG: hypothetical protein NT061_07700 [Spirochaetes bacterium]|nr:hypothetical protein [Spirochaetota bacterium]